MRPIELPLWLRLGPERRCQVIGLVGQPTLGAGRCLEGATARVRIDQAAALEACPRHVEALATFWGEGGHQVEIQGL